jgi:hypothetical protein
MSLPLAAPLARYRAEVAIGAKAGKFAAATVTVDPDLIEYQSSGLRIPDGVGGALVTGGLSLLASSKTRGSDTILARSIQGVTTGKVGLGQTTVRVAAGAGMPHFKLRKRDAGNFRQLVVTFVSGGK